ncbi:MAG: hypothetical protein Q7P63_16850 [Verrucomicrobiota bacterium JB022]|nr:hypothetical protein [Verrucomicrobiota bacterium JB022]
MLGYIFAIIGVVLLIVLAFAIRGPAKNQGLNDAKRLRPDERAGTSRSEPVAEEPQPGPVNSINRPRTSH